MVTTAETPVEVAATDQGADGIALRLPASGEGGYGEFVLTQLNLPVVSVPRARRDPTNDLTPVTINDWLLYSVVTGDELDTQVFGHRDPFRDLKRRWVFEIAYGLYDEELATLTAKLRRLDLEITAAESEAEVIRQFLAGTTVGKPEELEADLASMLNRSEALRAQAAALATAGSAEPGGEIAAVRAKLLTSRRELDELREQERQARAHLGELRDLEKQLATLSQRLTRSIVAGEWMIDFDFVVCPRCGSDLDRHRAEHPLCYLCEQPEPDVAVSQETLIREQDRVVSQIEETKQLIHDRQGSLADLEADASRRSVELRALSSRLDVLTNDFVSSRAAEIQALAAEAATVDANIKWTNRYLEFYRRQTQDSERLTRLRDSRLALDEEIQEHHISVAAADEHIAALEQRMLDYLTRLHVPQLGDLLTVKINRQTYLPEVSTRTFDELSSQGLKTLVNVAHALAHHTVAIDRELGMPGLLVLDGVSANSGKEGLEHDRIVDMYELFAEVAATYAERLQLIIVDNDLPPAVADSLSDRIILTLSQQDRLIRFGPVVEGSDDS
jgi:hypothetical protein